MFGWLTPKHEFIACKAYEHLDVARNDPRLQLPEVMAAIKELDDDYAEREAMSERGEHPEWHNYDSCVSDARQTSWAALLKAGFIRVGTSYDDRLLHFEGIPIALQAHAAYCKEFAASYAYTPAFDPQKKIPGYTDPTYAKELAAKSKQREQEAATIVSLAATNPIGGNNASVRAAVNPIGGDNASTKRG